MNADLAVFLAELRGRLATWPARTGRPERLDAVRRVSGDEDLSARFAAAAVAAGARVAEATSAEWVERAVRMLQDAGVRRAVIAPESLAAVLRAQAVDLVRVAAEAEIELHANWDDAALFDADAGITGVRCAVAETGSLLCVSGAGNPRGASLIPPYHLAIVTRSQIVADLVDVYAELAGSLAETSNVNLITGPSKTADIEGVLVTGVHGPGVVQVLLVADDKSSGPWKHP